MNPSQIGFIRGLGIILLAGACDYIAKNVGASGFVSGTLATLIATLASTFEHAITADTGKALFGTTRVR